MGEGKWNLLTASTCVLRNKGKIKGGHIVHLEPGIKVLGAIDYLVHYCGHVYEGKLTK